MAQYYELKNQYADAILLFRVGDFYETFAEDAVIAAEVLGIVLTARNNGSSKVELAGFPHHSLDTYLPKLVQAGYRVAVCDQLEKPSKHKKLVKRGVTEIVTPGVTINDTILDRKSNNYLAALHFGKKGQLGLALLDISTGEFLVSEGDKSYLNKLLQSFQPSELLYSKTCKQETLAWFGDRYYQYGVDDWVFAPDYAQEKLYAQFEVTSMKGFGVHQMELAQIAAGAILHYVASTENTNLQHITNVARIQPERYVWMDQFTIRNLELVHSTGVPLVDVIDHTVSPMGTRLLKKWMLLPLKDRQAVEARHAMVQYFYEQEPLMSLFETQVRQMGDLERLIAKVPLGKINPREVKQLEKSLQALVPLKEALLATNHPQLQSIGERLQLCTQLRERIATQLVEEPPVKLEKGNTIGSGVSDELDELRDLVQNSKDHLLQIQQTEAANTGIDNLKIGFNNVFGYYLEVTNKYKNKGLVPEHWVRKQTLTNAERYITDDLKVLEVKILGAQENIAELELQLYQALVVSLVEYISPVQQNAHLLAQLDCLASFAKAALLHYYCRPEMNDGLTIDIKAGRHPVIERQLALGEEYVPNDLYLSNEEQQLIMITGPNMSGKSALLRQTALIVLLAQMGSFVPAASAKLGMIDKVFTRVGASDNLSSGESTFMVEMNETASILNNISERSLILLDEIGRGTSTYDGISIAWSIAEFLHSNTIAHPKTLFATHYHELNELAAHYDRIKNFHVSTKELKDEVLFLRQLQEGGSHHSFGIHVAKMAGMPRYIVERAKELLLQLEQKRVDDNEDLSERLANVQTHQPTQLTFFDAEPDPTFVALKDKLAELDLNRLTPIECMMQLDALKKLVTDS